MDKLVQELLPWAEKVLLLEIVSMDVLTIFETYKLAKDGNAEAMSKLARAAKHSQSAHVLLAELSAKTMLEGDMPFEAVSQSYGSLIKAKPSSKRGQQPVADAFIREEAYLKAKEIAESGGPRFSNKADAEDTNTACHVVAEALSRAYGDKGEHREYWRFKASWIADAKRKKGAITRL